MMTRAVNERQQQGVHIVDRHRESTEGRYRNAAIPQLLKRKTIGDHLEI